jgi:hypothetical protein
MGNVWRALWARAWGILEKLRSGQRGRWRSYSCAVELDERA